MTTAISLEPLLLPGAVARSDRRRQFVTENTNAPWAARLRPGDRFETAGTGRETVALVVEEVCVHSGGYAGRDGCLRYPNRDYRTQDADLFEVVGTTFAALQFEPEVIRSARPAGMTVVVYTIERGELGPTDPARCSRGQVPVDPTNSDFSALTLEVWSWQGRLSADLAGPSFACVGR